MDLNVIELYAASLGIVEIPGFTKGRLGSRRKHLEARRKEASTTSYYKAGDCAVGQELVSAGDSGAAPLAGRDRLR